MISEEVIREAALGDPAMSRRRLEALAGMTVLKVTEEVRLLAKSLLAKKILPSTVIADALHAATASINRTDYLLTWNCRHLANPHLQKALRSFMSANGLTLPEICTPDVLTID